MRGLDVKQTVLPLKEWNETMQSAVGNICKLGTQLIANNREVSERADEVCRNWSLAERQAGEQKALEDIICAARDILGHINNAMHGMSPRAMQLASDSIEENLPLIEDAFLTVRHCAQDLLHWVQRYGPEKGDALQAAYRASYDELIAFAPVLKPRLESFQQELLELTTASNATKETRRLLSAVTSYNSVVSTAHEFVRAVVTPPMGLVFEETEEFLTDLQNMPVGLRGPLGSNLNDCCQNLLYNPSGFYRVVKPVEHEQPDGIESSLVVFSHKDDKVLLTVEDDPIFDQTTIHLLRIVRSDGLDEACASVISALQEEWV